MCSKSFLMRRDYKYVSYPVPMVFELTSVAYTVDIAKHIIEDPTTVASTLTDMP